jgi:hypothetical protein
MRKNLKASEWKDVAHRIQKRKREGLDSDIYFNDTLIPPKKVKKEVSRHSIPTYISGILDIVELIFGPLVLTHFKAPSPEASDSIRVGTPLASLSYNIGLDNLPFFQFQTLFESRGTR